MLLFIFYLPHFNFFSFFGALFEAHKHSKMDILCTNSHLGVKKPGILTGLMNQSY